MPKPSILLTGATGFLGRSLIRALPKGSIVAATRAGKKADDCLYTVPLDLSAEDFTSLDLSGIQTIIHVAGLAHDPSRPEADFLRINTRATAELAKRAAHCGVRRFILISSIGVNGNHTAAPFTAFDLPAPYDAYSHSKHEAERALQNIARASAMEYVILRPPLVYGPGAPGNFGRLLNLARKNLPLPLGAIRNRRSLVGIDNLTDFIVRCAEHPAAANQTFLVSDDHDVSSTELLETMVRAAGKKPRLIPVLPHC